MNYEKTMVSLVYCMIGSVYDGVYLQILCYTKSQCALERDLLYVQEVC